MEETYVVILANTIELLVIFVITFFMFSSCLIHNNATHKVRWEKPTDQLPKLA